MAQHQKWRNYGAGSPGSSQHYASVPDSPNHDAFPRSDSAIMRASFLRNGLPNGQSPLRSSFEEQPCEGTSWQWQAAAQPSWEGHCHRQHQPSWQSDCHWHEGCAGGELSQFEPVPLSPERIRQHRCGEPQVAERRDLSGMRTNMDELLPTLTALPHAPPAINQGSDDPLLRASKRMTSAGYNVFGELDVTHTITSHRDDLSSSRMYNPSAGGMATMTLPMVMMDD